MSESVDIIITRIPDQSRKDFGVALRRIGYGITDAYALMHMNRCTVNVSINDEGLDEFENTINRLGLTYSIEIMSESDSVLFGNLNSTAL